MNVDSYLFLFEFLIYKILNTIIKDNLIFIKLFYLILKSYIELTNINI